MKRMEILIVVGSLGPIVGLAQDEFEALNKVSLDQAIVFSAPDGSSVEITAGTYNVASAATGHLQMVAVDGGGTTILNATSRRHDEAVDDALALLISADEGMIKHLLLLLPNGEALEAVGSVGGIITRGTRRMSSQQRIKASIGMKFAQTNYKTQPLQQVTSSNRPPASAGSGTVQGAIQVIPGEINGWEMVRITEYHLFERSNTLHNLKASCPSGKKVIGAGSHAPAGVSMGTQLSLGDTVDAGFNAALYWQYPNWPNTMYVGVWVICANAKPDTEQTY